MSQDETKQEIVDTLGGRSEAELRQLALDIVDGRVFTNRDIRKGDEDMFGMIFLPVSLGDSRVRSTLESSGLVYAPWDQALPRSINGYPIFMEMHGVLKKDVPTLEHYVRTLFAQRKAFMEAPIPPVIPPPGS